MWLQRTCYGCVLADPEPVYVHRPGNQYGEIEVATPIQLSEHGSHRSRTVVGDQFTVFLWRSGSCICWEDTVGDGDSEVAQFRGSNDAYRWV